jgi:fluoride exporter
MLEFVLVAVAGGLGALARYGLDNALAPQSERFPVGIFVVNALGSLLLGVVVGLDAAGTMPAHWATVLGVGFCGAFTTFSTAAVDAARFAASRQWRALAWQWLGMFVVCSALGAVGFAVTAP